jgi:hypothetical protein
MILELITNKVPCWCGQQVLSFVDRHGLRSLLYPHCNAVGTRINVFEASWRATNFRQRWISDVQMADLW